MSDYSQTTDFSAKDDLTTGDPEKVILGADVDAELAAIAAAIATKADAPVADSALADMAQARIKGRATGAGTGDPTDLTAGQVATILLTSSTITSGSYTPTIASVVGASNIAGEAGFYIRIGSIVLVSVEFTFEFSTPATQHAQISCDFPIASTDGDAKGTFTARDVSGSPDYSLGGDVNDSGSDANFFVGAPGSAGATGTFEARAVFMYVVA